MWDLELEEFSNQVDLTWMSTVFYFSSTTERAHLRKQWEKERHEMETQIDKINEEIQKKETELASLVAIDNALWKQACELELEIRGYKAMMLNENQNQPGFSIE